MDGPNASTHARVALTKGEGGGYWKLADRLGATLTGPGSRHLNLDLLTLGQAWAFGLRQLDEASQLARYASGRVSEHMRQGKPDGPVTDPAYLRAIQAARATEIVETYHTLALVALAQPLWEAVAVTFLSYPAGLPARPLSKRHNQWWPTFLSVLDVSNDADLAQLKAEARATDATMVVARDRLVAHPLANRATFTGRDATGRLTRRGRIQWDENGDTLSADNQLREINEQLPAEHRSQETNRWGLAQDLARCGAHMTRAMRENFKMASRDLGLSFEFDESARRLVGLVDAIASWSAARPE